MRLSFEIPANRVQEIINCVQQESELDKRINSFELIKLDCRDGEQKDVFIVNLCSDNAFFIQRMAEAAREKTEGEKELLKYYANSYMAKTVAALRKPFRVDVEELKEEWNLEKYKELKRRGCSKVNAEVGNTEDQDGKEK